MNSSGKITRALALTIPDKKATTLLPIIQDNVVPGSLVFTDEHKSYSGLSKLGFKHLTVCHKKMFVNKESGAHTQNVESFNNCMKCAIKEQKGIITVLRQPFLDCLCFIFNNKNDLLEAVLNLIKC